MKKIFFLNSTLSLGGAEKMAYEVIMHLDKARFSTKVRCLYRPGTIAKMLMAQGVDIEHGFMKNKYDLLGLYRFFCMMKKECIDLLYLESSPLTLFWGFLFAKILGVPRIVTFIHNMRAPARWIRFKSGVVSRLILPRLDRIGVASRARRDSLIREYNLDPKKVELINNAIDIDRFKTVKDKAGLRKEIGISKNEKIIGMVGRLVPEKAYDVFLKSAKIIAGGVQNAKFVIIGDGEERANLERLASVLGLRERIIFLGERHDAADLISLFDVAVLSSRIESFPLALLEYMAARRPIVATDVGGNSEIILHGRSGLIVPPGKPELIASAIMKLLNDPGNAKKIAVAARRIVEEKFSLPHMIVKMERFFLSHTSLRPGHHIIMLGPSLDVKGGISSFAKNFLASELPKEFRITFHPTTIDGSKILKIIFFMKSLGLFFIRLLIDKKIRIIHICSSSKGSFYRKAVILSVSKFFRKSVIFHIHGAGFDVFYDNSDSLTRFFIRKTLDISDSIIVLSRSWHAVVKGMTKNTGIKIIPNPIDTSDFKSIRTGRDFSKFNVFTAGRLGKRKGTYDILEIAPVIISQVPDVRFCLAGDGDVDKIRQLCRKKGIEKNVVVLDWLNREELLVELKRASMFLLPSYHEGFPVAILEAMASGLPVISTRVGGIPELVEDGVNGFLVDPGRKEELAGKIIDLLRDTELRKAMARNNIRKIDSCFRLDHLADKFFAEYEYLTSRNQACSNRSGNIMIKDLNMTVKKWIWRRLHERKSFENIYSSLKEIEGFSKDDIRKLQLESLKDVIRYSYSNVPYYRRLFDAIGLDVSNGFTARDITRIPVLTRDKVMENPYDFLSSRSKGIFLRKTGSTGTTGTPIVLYRDRYSINFENAILWKQRDWAGIKQGDRKVTLRGEVIIPGSVKRPPFWKYDYIAKEMILSSFHISRDMVRYYVDILKDFKPVYVEAYPSSLYILAKFIKESGLGGVSFKAAITSSETLQDYKRSLIEEVFDCKVYDFYGNAERVAAIATCPSGNYHVLPEYSFVEFLDSKDIEGYKEIIGTTFFNMVMPFLRYKTEDVVLPLNTHCECGRDWQMVEKIVGRFSEFIVTPEGRFVSTMDCVYKGLNNIIEAQMIQEDYGFIRIRLVPGKDFSSSDEKMLIDRMIERVGPNVKIDIDKVDHIERKGTNKFRAVISNIRKP